MDLRTTFENRIKSIQGEFKNLFKNSSSNSFVNRKEKKCCLLSKIIDSDYQKELKKFFKSIHKDQLAVETIIINYVPKDFETKEYAEIDTAFYNVKFKGKHWDGINLRFGTDVNRKKNKQWRNFNFFRIEKGYSFPDPIKSWKKAFVSDWNGHKVLKSSFPSGPKMDRFVTLKKDEKLLIKRLLQSMEHVLQYANRQPQLYQNLYAQKWLQERVNEVKEKKLKSSSGFYDTTKVFSFPGGAYQTGGFFQQGDGINVFNCSAKRFKFDPSKDFTSNVLDYNFDQNILKSGNIEFSISELLIPELNLKVDNKDYLSVLTHEGYQLK